MEPAIKEGQHSKAATERKQPRSSGAASAQKGQEIVKPAIEEGEQSKGEDVNKEKKRPSGCGGGAPRHHCSCR